MKKYLYILFILPLLFGVNGCYLSSVNCLDGSGEITKENRNVGDFDKIYIDGGLDLYIKQGDSISLAVEIDDNLIKYLRTTVDDRELTISESKSLCSKIKKAYIVVPNLKQITISGAGSVIAKSPINLNYLQIEGNGASDVYFQELNCPNLSIDLSGSGDLKIDKGIGGNLAIRTSGAGDIRMSNFKADSAKVEISGAGDVRIWSDTFLLIKIFGAGDISYKGNPKIVKKIVGAGSVTKLD
jgi:hypothetical protein